MSPDRARELWSRFLFGETLPSGEERDLVEALEADPSLREEFLQESEADGLLRAQAAGDDDPELSVRAFQECLEADRDATRFIREVHLRRGSGTTRRVRRTRRSIRRGPEARLMGGLVAAAVLLAVAVLFTRPAPPAPKRIQEARTEPAPRPPEAAQEVARPGSRRRERPEGERRAEGSRPKGAEEPAPIPARLETAREEPRKAAEEARRPEPAPAPTRASVAVLEGVEGEVTLDKVPARKGQSLLVGQDLETGTGPSAAVLVYPDKTRVEVGAASAVREFRVEGGKRFRLEQGTLRAEVVRQPAAQPLVIATPHGEATVLGTTLRLVVDPAGKGSTRLEVIEGKVRLKSSLDGKNVEVPAGHQAVAAAGVALASRPLERVIWRYDLEDSLRPAAVLEGAVSAGPPRPGSRFCLESSDYIVRSYGPAVNFQLDEKLAAEPAKLRLRFRYFAPAGGTMTVQFFNETAGDNFAVSIGDLIAGRWAWADLPLSYFVRWADRSRLGKGDRLVFLNMFVVQRGNPKVYWDDIELVEVPGR